jgi:predicted metal-dependent enzyme (double-stranded beta helix superfamily)
LYLSVGRPGRYNLPHTHPTWSVVAAVRGVERNYVYDRVDDGQVAGRGILRLREEVDIGSGKAIAFRPGEFHYIVVTSEETSLQLHAYGVAIDRWTGTLPVFPTPDSGVYDLIPAPFPGLRIADPVAE